LRFFTVEDGLKGPCYGTIEGEPTQMTVSRPELFAKRVPFAHPAEAEFARLLDFYGVQWLYEPHTFALARDHSGGLRSAFSPDFYLPKEDMYVELTTMSSRQISRKHRKLREFRAAYPQKRIQLWNRRQIQSLLAKYGIPLAKVASNE
jgi:hypoxanthine phosphoribosyltransferase